MNIDIVILPVQEYNRTVKPDPNFFRHTFKTWLGNDRLTGYVSSYKDSHVWAKTKKESYNKLIKALDL
jgi:hypothetical protein